MDISTYFIKIAASKKSRVLAVSLLGATALGGAGAYASGLGLVDQNTDAIAHAYAGVTVESDPGIAYYNPAGMVLLNGNQIEQSLNVYDITSHFNGSNTTSTNGGPVSGSAKGFVESTLAAGTFNVISLPHGIKAGLSVTVPIGGRIKYPSDFVGNFQGSEALVTTLQLGLAIAVPITSQLSIGFGPEINWFQNILSENQNIGSPSTSGTFTGKGYGLGYNIGLLYQPLPGTRIGIDYRSKIDQKFKGTETLSVQDPFIKLILAQTHIPNTTAASDKWAFPQQISFGVYQQVTDKLSLMFSALFTTWSQETGNIVVDPQTTFVTGGSIYTPFRYRDTWTLGAGANYQLTPGLTLMTGLGYDETPVKKQYRQDLVPDSDRVIVGVGGSLQLTPNAKAVLGYQHIIIANSSINQSRLALFSDGSLTNIGAGTLTGEYKIAVDVFSAAIIGQF